MKDDSGFRHQAWLDAIAAIQADVDRIIRGGEPDPVRARALKATADEALVQLEIALSGPPMLLSYRG